MSSAAGAGSAVLGWVSTAGSHDIDDQHVAPVEPPGQPGGGDRGDRRGVGEHEPDPGRRAAPGRSADRPPRSSAPPKSPRSPRPTGKTAAPHTHPGPPRGRPAGAPTGWRPRQARGRSTNAPRQVTATASGVRATCAANKRRNRHRRGRRLGQHRPVAPPIQAGVLILIEQIHRRQPPGGVGGHAPPTPAPTARSAPRCWPRRTRRCEIPPPRRSRRAHRPRSSVRPAKTQIHAGGGGVHRQRRDLQITQGQPGGEARLCPAKFCQANITWTNG